MLVQRSDGTFTCSIYDVLVILRDSNTGRFHVTFFEWCPFPGELSKDTQQITVIRLRSKMHHTTGASTFLDALVHLADMRKKLDILDECVVTTEFYHWGGEPCSWIAKAWRNNPFQSLNPGVRPKPPVHELPAGEGNPVLLLTEGSKL